MKQVFNVNGKIMALEVPAPSINENEVLVKNVYSAVSSGTETTSIDSAKGSLILKGLSKKEIREEALNFLRAQGFSKTLEQIKRQKEEFSLTQLGYSCCGIVIKVGRNVQDFSVGDYVACAGGGYANHAEFVAVPKNLVAKVPKDVDLKDASLTTLGAIVLQGIRRADVCIGNSVAVIGLGLLGQIAAQILTSFGCNVIGIDIDKKRVELAKKCGLKNGFISDKNMVSNVMFLTENIGVDSVIIYAGTKSSDPVDTAMKICRKKGIVVVVGDVGMELKRDEFYKKELDFRISTSYGPGRYDPQYEEKGIDYPVGYVRWTENRNMKEFLRLLSENLIDIKPLINKEYPLSNASDAYNSLQNENDTIGVVFSYGREKDIQLTTKLSVTKRTIDKNKINVGLIGCGSFAKQHHLPNIAKIPYLNLVTVSSKTGKNAKTAAELFDAVYCTTDYKEIINDKDVDLIIISTRHNLHAPISIESAKAGKHIFTEKPMALSLDDCKKVYNAVTKNKINYSIGFNRRFSPLAQDAKRILEKRKDPAIVTIRVNSAGMVKDHWINDPVEGGGAIVGEGCHFFDLCNWFIGSEPRRIFSESISSSNESVISNNNIVSTISYKDGSVASIVYTTIGNLSYPKERIEIFADGGVICIDDFKESVLSGFNVQGKKLKRIEKGQYTLLDEYAKLLRGESGNKDIPNIKNATDATILSLKAMESIKTGKIQSFNY